MTGIMFEYLPLLLFCMVESTVTADFTNHTKIKQVVAEIEHLTDNSKIGILADNTARKSNANSIESSTDKETLQTQDSQAKPQYTVAQRYEVTENVSDVPDDRTPAGPIVPDYSPKPDPIPTVNPNNTITARPTTKATARPNVTPTIRPNNSNNCSSDDNNKVQIRIKKNKINIQVVAAFDKTEPNDTELDGDTNVWDFFKDSFYNIHEGFVNSFNSLFHFKERFKRDTTDTKKIPQNVDKMDYFVKKKHISIT